jgi:hypothetical protein
MYAEVDLFCRSTLREEGTDNPLRQSLSAGFSWLTADVATARALLPARHPAPLSPCLTAHC